MICSTINQLSAFGLTVIIATLWNAAVMGSFGLMLFDVIALRHPNLKMLLVGGSFAVALLCMTALVFAGVCT